MITHLSIHQLRNLGTPHPAELSLAPCNIFIGDNGSGKTSLLESIFLLSRGKTFRQHQPKHYITHGKDTCTVFANISGQPPASAAIQKDKNAATVLRLNQSTVAIQAPLSKLLPTLVLDPSGMAVLDDRAEGRRQLLDWLCFYCDEYFYRHWLAYQKLLKQRNSLLKSLKYAPASKNPHLSQELRAWDVLLSKHGQQLHHIRQTVFAQWQHSFAAVLNQLLPAYSERIHLSYQPGFDPVQPLEQILSERLASDCDTGYTRIGAHRADVAIYLHHENKKEAAAHVLSRGEKKLLITALKLSQLPLVCAHAPTPLVLIDDIGAELGANALQRLLAQLANLPCQLFITALNDDISQHLTLPSAALARFRVQQGRFTSAQ